MTEYVRDANGLDRFKVTLLFTPLGTDLLLGGTHHKQLVIWKHDKTAAYRCCMGFATVEDKAHSTPA